MSCKSLLRMVGAAELFALEHRLGRADGRWRGRFCAVSRAGSGLLRNSAFAPEACQVAKAAALRADAQLMIDNADSHTHTSAVGRSRAVELRITTPQRRFWLIIPHHCKIVGTRSSHRLGGSSARWASARRRSWPALSQPLGAASAAVPA